MHRKLAGLLALTGLLMLASCGRGDDARTTAETSKKPANSEPAYESPGKPNVQPVDISYRLLGTPAVGQPLEIELTMISSLPASSTGYRLSVENGLVVDPGFNSIESAAADAFKPRKEIVRITPATEGRFYLTVIGSAVVNGQPASRQIMIPIQVGAVGRELQQMGEIRTDRDGNPIVSLPAETPD